MISRPGWPGMAVSGESNTCADWIAKPSKARKILCVAAIYTLPELCEWSGNPNCVLNRYHNTCEKTSSGDLLEISQVLASKLKPQYLVCLSKQINCLGDYQ
jgi:hypothetical protein